MRVYLASRFSRGDELLRYKADLERHGIEVTSRWLLGGHEWAGTDDDALPIDVGERFAREDLEDLRAADVVVCFTEAPPTPFDLEPNRGEEEWLPVAQSQLGYEVSSWGRVRNGAGDIVVGSFNRGYRRVKPDGKHSTNVHVHKLVADAFLGVCPEGHEIDHRDGDKANNWRGNLEYVTHTENVRRAAERMRGGPHARENNGRAKLTSDQAAEIRLRYAAGEQNKAALGREYGVSDTVIRNVVNFVSWRPESLDTGRRGGRHCEFGYALATRKEILVVGPRENVFYCLEEVRHRESWEEALAQLALWCGYPTPLGTES